ncbi:MAG: hypothetical protein ABEJ89_09015 [Haloarculaceae archaeon]
MATSSSNPTTDRTPSVTSDDLPYLLPRAGIALVFVGFGLWELFVPHYWMAYVPGALAGHAWTLRLVQFHGLLLTTTATALLLPAFETSGAIVASLVLCEICLDILTSHGVTSILLRDVGLLVVAVGLVWLPYSHTDSGTETADG